MNGYREEEVLGKVPKCFKVRLQMVLPSEIRKAILEQNHLKTVMNYKKNGMFMPVIKGYPVFNNKGELII
jgi:hypothetical protein